MDNFGQTNYSFSDKVARVLDDRTHRVIDYANTGVYNPIDQPMFPPLGGYNGSANAGIVSGSVTSSNGQESLSGMPKHVENQYKVRELLTNPYQRQRIDELARTINSSFHDFWVDDNEQIKEVLSDLPPEDVAALEIAYGEMYGAPNKLRQDLKSHLGGLGDKNSKSGLGSFRNAVPWLTAIAGIVAAPLTGGISLVATAGAGVLGAANALKNKNQFGSDEAIDILNDAAKENVENASIALKDAMEGAGTDEATVRDILNGSKDEFLSEVMFDYQNKFGVALSDDIRGDFSFGAEDELTLRLTRALANSRNQYQSAYNYGYQF